VCDPLGIAGRRPRHRVPPFGGQGLNLAWRTYARSQRVIAEREACAASDIRIRLLETLCARARQTSHAAMLGLTDGLLQLFSHPIAPGARNFAKPRPGLVNAATPRQGAG
jgi:2-polyprenyl-6-methoxyphenol hydroxylase-like FAD-dependent oxidoreductase